MLPNPINLHFTNFTNPWVADRFNNEINLFRKLANDDVEDEDEKEEIPNLDQIFKVL